LGLHAGEGSESNDDGFTREKEGRDLASRAREKEGRDLASRALEKEGSDLALRTREERRHDGFARTGGAAAVQEIAMATECVRVYLRVRRGNLPSCY